MTSPKPISNKVTGIRAAWKAHMAATEKQQTADPNAEKVRENRLRRAAGRQGYRLVKSRRRDPRALDYGLYALIADSAGNHLTGAQASESEFARGAGMTLDQIESQLTG